MSPHNIDSYEKKEEQNYFLRHTLSVLLLQLTVKFLNFRMPENFAVNYLKFKKRGQSFGYFVKKMQMV